MQRVVLVLLVSLFAAGSAAAQTCKAVSGTGEPLAGAAKTSHMKKCCEDSAKSADGKMLSGAAKTSYIQKCMKG